MPPQTATSPGGPGKRYALGPSSPAPHGEPSGAVQDLPEAYGTRRLLLAARDPHWLYAHWDLTAQQLRECNAASMHGHLVLRIFELRVEGTPAREAHVHPESRNWFVEVDHANTRYVGELGYYADRDRWVSVAVSAPTLTPPDTLAEEGEVEFATIPLEVPFETLLAMVKAAVSEQVPLAEAVEQLRAEGHENLPAPESFASQDWTPEQTRALEAIVSVDHMRRVWIGSLEVTQLVARQLHHALAGEAKPPGMEWFSWPGAVGAVGAVGGPGAVSSPQAGVPPARRGFWFNVNAELVIYGATEPDAIVSIGGRRVVLRPDGSFSFRFALPDGEFELPVAAVSRSGDDRRGAELQFRRATSYSGEVGRHPQDEGMKPPNPEHAG